MRIIILSVLFIVTVLISFQLFNKTRYGEIKSDKADDNRQDQKEEIDLKLEIVRYSLLPVDTDRVRLTSGNYGFEMIFSDLYEFSTGRSFNNDNPQNDEVHVGVMDKDDVSDLTFTIAIGLLNYKNIEQIVQEAVDAQKRNFNPTANPEEIMDEDMKLEKATDTINGEKVIWFQSRGAFDQDEIFYFFVKGDKYYTIYSGLNHGKHFNPGQLAEIRETVNSFKFVSSN